MSVQATATGEPKAVAMRAANHIASFQPYARQTHVCLVCSTWCRKYRMQDSCYIYMFVCKLIPTASYQSITGVEHYSLCKGDQALLLALNSLHLTTTNAIERRPKIREICRVHRVGSTGETPPEPRCHCHSKPQLSHLLVSPSLGS